MLLALEKRLLAAVTKTEFNAALPVGTLTLMELYPFPRYGEIDGTLVRIEGEGNRIGFSPVTKCVELGEHGETAWIPTELVKNIRLEPWMGGSPTRGKKTTPAAKA
jgi:hypothetical protein